MLTDETKEKVIYEIEEAVKAEQQAKLMGGAYVCEAIRKILEVRSLVLHIATSDIGQVHIKTLRFYATELDDMLLATMVLLPDYRPEWPGVLALSDENGAVTRILWLQSLKGENARYVPQQEFEPDKFVYEPIDRLTVLADQRSRSLQVLQEIQALEGLETSAVEASEEVASAAQTTMAVLDVLADLAEEPA